MSTAERVRKVVMSKESLPHATHKDGPNYLFDRMGGPAPFVDHAT
jgi:hypothetical protein